MDNLDSRAKYIESNYGVPTYLCENLALLERGEKGVSLFPVGFLWNLAKVQLGGV